MTETPSLSVMIESLQRTVASHREREAFHAQQQAHYAQQEKFHGEERARHAAELEAASRHLEELREMAERLGKVVQQARVVPPETAEEAVGRIRRRSTGRYSRRPAHRVAVVLAVTDVRVGAGFQEPPHDLRVATRKART
ncbi:MAG TPA: hypothetical protein VLE27_16615 [Thermoanaerobaculia bacterium]|nr:hypothetical protein [Thermoanaerobaculia bacterium]